VLVAPVLGQAQSQGRPSAPSPAPAATTATPAPPRAEGPVAIQVVTALAWPVVVVIALFALRPALNGFLQGLGSRVTKLSVFKVELELAAATRAEPSPTLEDIRTAPQAAPIADSSRALFQHVQDATPADYAVIALGTGDEWLTSRLYIAATLLERMRGVRCLVFLETRDGNSGRFLALAAPTTVRWALAHRYPWLEIAYRRASAIALPVSSPPLLPHPQWVAAGQPVVTSDRGTLDPNHAQWLAREFVQVLQQPVPPPPPAGLYSPPPSAIHDPEWVTLAGYRERANWVTPGVLAEFLPPRAFQAWMPEMRDAPRAKRTRAVLRREGAFVALLDEDRRFLQLVDRHALLAMTATQLGEEPNA
jgi:hypothetical protein